MNKISLLVAINGKEENDDKITSAIPPFYYKPGISN